MKKYLLLSSLITMMFGTSNAVQLTPEQALARLNHGSRAQVSDMRLVYTASEGINKQFYVFNTGANDGFSIISADDCISPLIGYADSGSFDPENIPDNMREWLKSYQRQIEAIIASGVVATQSRAAASRASIAPMVTTRWNQSSPYNNDCPMDGNNRSVTGCVATAMAQVMKYHNWPVKGAGSNTYTWKNSAGEQKSLYMDFSTTTFDWANMTDTYSSASTATQNAAVATLMAACGYSVNMNYSSNESGAMSPMIAYALTKYFNYDGGIQYLLRDYYGIEEWENKIYAELAAKRPVVYDGVTGTNAGHEFVCDGYDNGYYHINWGWGGVSDGYFKLTLLTPEVQGIGGSTSGYNFNQGATIGIQKNTSGSTAAAPAPYITADAFTVDDPLFASTGSKKCTRTDYVTFGTNFMNSSTTPISMNFGLKLTNKSTNAEKYIKCAYEESELMGMSFAMNGLTGYPVRLSEFPSTGTWVVTPAYYNFSTNAWGDILVPISNQVITATCTSQNVTFNSQSAVTVKATNLQILTPMYVGSNYKLSADIDVEAGEYYGIITAKLYQPGANNAVATDTLDIIDAVAGEKLNFEGIGNFKTISTTISQTTEFELALADNTGKVISDRIKVSVSPAVTQTSYTVTNILFPTATTVNGIPTMPCDEFTVSATVTCTEGYLTDPVVVYMFPRVSGTVSSLKAFISDNLFIQAGSSKIITIKGAYDSPGEYFLAFTVSSGWSAQKSFNLSEAASGIDTPVENAEVSLSPNPATDFISVTSPSTINLVEIYSLSGMRMTAINPAANEASIDVASYPAGHYVVRIINDNGITTKRLIKK
ncbi:MAG: T9SS type A sorting domain-containing protein [Bacteroides sp.]|nr:T9SS type A sorting domain-containing protein [Bacteroides sp.]